MSLDERKVEVAKIVCEQFVMGRATPRKPLVQIVRNPAVVDEMANQFLLRAEKGSSLYYPTLGTFVLLPEGDERLSKARRGFSQVLFTMHNLYQVEEDGVDHTPEELVSEVEKRFGSADAETVLLGLYLACGTNFGAVARFRRSDDQLTIQSFGIGEHVMTIDPVEDIWEQIAPSLLQHAEAKPLAPVSLGRNQAASNVQSNLPPAKKKSLSPDGWRDAKLLGEGGQGRTYLVRRADEDDHDQYVFKRLKNAKRSDRLDSEIRALRALTHPGILRIVDSGTHDGKPFYIAEYCKHGDLSKRNLEGMTVLEKLLLFRQICSAVAAAHEKGIIHRDLKPSNILMRSDGSIVVADFGLCLDLHSVERFTETHEAVGPRHFMAPELEDGRLEGVTPATDTYSLGKLLYFLLAGRIFSREKHREPEYDLTDSARIANGAGMEFAYELLDASIVPQPEQRYRNASEFVVAVDLAIRKLMLNAHVLSMKGRQPCLFCVEGDYRPLGSPSKFSMKLICFRCGNIQEFNAEWNGWKNWWLP